MALRRGITNSDQEAESDDHRELFEACKSGDVVKVKRLCSPQNVNVKDTAGRKSTPLHFAAGMEFVYNL